MSDGLGKLYFRKYYISYFVYTILVYDDTCHTPPFYSMGEVSDECTDLLKHDVAQGKKALYMYSTWILCRTPPFYSTGEVSYANILYRFLKSEVEQGEEGSIPYFPRSLCRTPPFSSTGKVSDEKRQDC
jgi:hypothetical protein